MEKITSTLLSVGVFPRQPAKPVPARGGYAEAKRPAERRETPQLLSLCVSSGVRSSDKALSSWSRRRRCEQLVTRERLPREKWCLSFCLSGPHGYDKMAHYYLIGYLQLMLWSRIHLPCEDT